MSPPETEAVLQAIADPATGRAGSPRLLLLAAHPDDETIGASIVLGRVPGAMVVYLTDGAPRDPQFRSPHVSGSRELYACVRAEEAASALSYVDVSRERIVFLGGVDQESILQASELLEELVTLIQQFQPTILLTHPYEGGHPDHDAAALLSRLSLQLAARKGAPVADLLEMTSYHAEGSTRVTGRFLGAPPVLGGSVDPAVQLKMSAEERTRKARMLGCYVSQWHVLSDIPLEPEQVRPAPMYDFTRSPHEGTLWYENLHWPITGVRWRELAAQVLAGFGELAWQ